jgi:protein-L-isoaspartate(D-aspartate) O-methyltransferase
VSEHAAARRAMVAHHLAARGIADRRVLAAMGAVPRERFVPEAQAAAAYDDRALPLPEGQTISQPFMVARTCELARIGPDAHVLDVGTGSGYQAAVLAELARSVVSIERIESLARTAAALLASLGANRRSRKRAPDGGCASRGAKPPSKKAARPETLALDSVRRAS